MQLTEDELEVAEASVRFALENCPVDGLLSTPDGAPVTLDDAQALLDKLREIQSSSLELGNDLLARLKAVMDYTSQNCPMECVAAFHDGRRITGKDIVGLSDRLGQSGGSH